MSTSSRRTATTTATATTASVQVPAPRTASSQLLAAPALAGMESLLTAVFEVPVRLRTGRALGALHLTSLAA